MNSRKFNDKSQEDEEYEEDDDEENVPSPSIALVVTVTVPGSSISNGGGGGAPISKPTATIVLANSSYPKRCRLELIKEKKPSSPSMDDSRWLFQWLWTDDDDIELLQGFLDYTSQRGSLHHNDTALFYDQIK
ncbi:putative transcription factor [Glycine soja]